MIDQSFLDLFTNIDSKEGFYLWLFMLISFLLGFLVALLLRWSRIRKLKKELKSVKSKQQTFDITIAGLEEKLQERNVELQEASCDKVDLMDRLTEMDKLQENHLTEVYQTNQLMEEIQSTNKTYAASIDDLNNQIIGLKTQNEQLSEATNDITTYNGSTETIGKDAYDTLQERLNSFEASLSKLSTENSQLRSDLQVIKKKENDATVTTSEEEPKLQITSEKFVLYDKIVVSDRHKDDLTKIEGIGEFLSKKLNSIGIFTYDDIAQWNADKIVEITSSIEYLPGRIIKDDWVGQAKAMTTGHTVSNSAKAKKVAPKRKKAKTSTDDLKIIEGIGPKIADVLNKAGIHNWTDLAAAEPGKLKEILEAAGGRFRMHTPYTWPLQARLAAAGRWDELKEYQEELKGGKE